MEQPTNLTALQERELHRALALLTGMKCEFCVVTPGGASFGDLQAAKSTRKRGAMQHPYGAITAHTKQHLNLDVPVGHTQRIPAGPYHPQRVQSTVCALIRNRWGEGAGATSAGTDYVEVLRVSDGSPA